MEIKFDVYFKKNLGTLFKSNEVDLNGKHAHVNIPLALVDRMEVNYLINGNKKYTDDVLITDIAENLIQIPFKSDVMKSGVSEFEIIAYMKNGDIKPSQTYVYNLEEGIGEGQQVSNENSSSDGHTHSNLNVLNSITQTKINEWNNKANKEHTHGDYAEKNHTHNANEIEGLDNIDIDLSNYYTKNETYNKTEIDNKMANMGNGGNVDLSNYYTKTQTDNALNSKANKVHTHSEYLTEHQDISHKADKENTYTKSQTDNKIVEEIDNKIGHKTYKYLTQGEYDLLSNEEKNNESIVYFITDSKEDVFSLKLVGNTLSLLKNGISVSSVVIPTSSSEGSDIPDEIPNPDEGDDIPDETPNPDEDGGEVIGYTNLLFNDDTFENPLRGDAPVKATYFYTSADTSREVVSGVLRLFSNTGDQDYGILIRCGYGDNKVYYNQFKVKSDVGLVAGSPQNAVLKTYKAVDDWTLVSYIYTDTSAFSHSMKLFSNDGGKLGGSVYMKEPMRICLTDLFGAGNEPTDVTECDRMFAKFVPGQRGY